MQHADRHRHQQHPRHAARRMAVDEAVGEEARRRLREGKQRHGEAGDEGAGVEHRAHVDRRPVDAGAFHQHRRERHRDEDEDRQRRPRQHGGLLAGAGEAARRRLVAAEKQRHRRSRRSARPAPDAAAAICRDARCAAPNSPAPKKPMLQNECARFMMRRLTRNSVRSASTLSMISTLPIIRPTGSSIRNSASGPGACTAMA